MRTRVSSRVATAPATVLGLGLGLGLVLGCAGAPREVTLPIDVAGVPDAWTAAADTSTAGGDGITAPSTAVSWWSTFGDDTLDALVAEAVAHNHDLARAAAAVDGALARARIAGADLWPQLSGSARASRDKQIFTGLPIGATGGELPSSESTSYRVSIDASWEVDLWGRLRRSTSAAAADVEGALAGYARSRDVLASRVAKAWFALIEAEQQVTLAAENAESHRRSLDYVDRQYTAGVTTALDVRLSRSDLAVAESQLDARREARDRAARQLEVLLGRYPGNDLQPIATLPTISAPAPAGLPATLLSRRPDLVQAERLCAAAGARVSAAQRALLPRITLTGSAGRTSDVLEDLTDGSFSIWSLVAGLTQPIFQGGRLRAQVAASSAAERDALHAYASAVLGAFAEVEAALVAEETLTRQEAHLGDAVEHAIAATRLADEQYRSGLVDIVTVLTSKRRALGAESELLAVRRRRLDTRIDLHLALGGGFDRDRVLDKESDPS